MGRFLGRPIPYTNHFPLFGKFSVKDLADQCDSMQKDAVAMQHALTNVRNEFASYQHTAIARVEGVRDAMRQHRVMGQLADVLDTYVLAHLAASGNRN